MDVLFSTSLKEDQIFNNQLLRKQILHWDCIDNNDLYSLRIFYL